MRRKQKQRISESIDLQQWTQRQVGQDWISHIFPRSMIEIEKMDSETFYREELQDGITMEKNIHDKSTIMTLYM